MTWNRATRVWWSYFWRSIVAAICGMVVAGVFGFMIGIVAVMLSVPIEVVQPVGLFIGLVSGLAISVVPIKQILGKDYGEFRLVLLSTTQSGNSAK